MTVTTCKLPKGDDSSSFFRIQIEWFSKGSFRMIVLDHVSVWLGEAFSEDLIDTSNSLSLKIEDYLQETRYALTTQGGADEFLYTIEDGKFWWKKIVDSNADLKIKFGSVPIEMVPSTEMIEHMMDTVVEDNYTLQKRVSSLEDVNENFKTEMRELKDKLNHYKNQKKIMEETLYGKFLEILNAKKQRIYSLEEKIGGLLNEPNTCTKISQVKVHSLPPSRNKSRTILKNKTRNTALINKKIVLSDDTEEETAVTPPKKPLYTSLEVIPSISKVDNSPTIEPSSLTYTRELSSGDQNHYDSDTDCDTSTEDDNNVDGLPISNVSNIPNYFDEEASHCGSIHLPVTTLPTEVQECKLNQVSKRLDAPTTPPINSVNFKSDREAVREHNTQQLLDELGI